MHLKLYNWILINSFIFYLNRTQKVDTLCLSILHFLKDGAVKYSGKSIRRPWERVNSVCKTKLNSGLLWDLSCSHYCSLGTIHKPVTSTTKLTIQNQSNLKTFKCSFLQHSPLNMSGPCLTLQVKIQNGTAQNVQGKHINSYKNQQQPLIF